MSFKEVKLKYIATLNPSKSELNLAAFKNKTVSFLPMDKIISPNNLDLSLEKTVEEVYSGYTYFRENDIVLAKVTPCFENGNIAVAKELKNGIGFGTTELHVLRVDEQLYDKEYIYYCLQLENFKAKAVANMYGVGGLKRIPTEFLSEYKFLVPDLKTQVAIRKYLNLKLTEISSLIENKNKLIKLLEQQRQSIITEAVTKGLNPSVKMKDSGVEWIGEIPEHWEEKKIKYLFYEANERNFNEDATLLSLFTSIGVKPRKEMEQKGNKAQTVINYKIVRKKDIVVNKLLAWMGAIGLSEYNGVTSPDYDVYRPLNTEKVEELYYHYYFRNHYFKGDCFKFGRGIMMMRWRTYPEQLKSILVPVPPKEEQIQIANYIEYKEKELAQTIKNIEKSIEKLKEYRQALIYEAVTGKIDVRDMELD